jgi:hypothetical protein
MAIRRVKAETRVRPACLRHPGRRTPAMRSIVVAGVAGLVVACATSGPQPGWYVEPSLPEEETAWFLASYPQSLWTVVRVVSIDDANINYSNFGSQYDYSRITWSVKVSPGLHRIESLHISDSFFTTIQTPVSFVAEFKKGGSYSIRGRSDDDRVQMWVEDTKTGETAGIGTVVVEDD